MVETISVTELNSRVKELFAKTPMVNDIWVTGEISNLKKYPSGYYFVLKDPTSEIHAVLFNSARARMQFEPTENMKVRAFGSIGMFVPRGTYQFIVEAMEKSGVGDRYIAFEALKKKLSEEGLFDQSHKRALPTYPRTIGVVTSQSGAVIHDIITTSASRFTADILLAPAMVQGEGAAQTIVAGIELLNKADVDVIIVGRGGGSIEDLWPFNEEIVARAIYNSKAPVVSAVGHETDFTIADFVADVRAPTPTGAAAVILRDKQEIANELQSFNKRMNNAMMMVTDRMRHSLQILEAKLDPSKASDSLDLYRMQVDDLFKTAERCLEDILGDMRYRFESVDGRLNPARALDEISSMGEKVEASLERIRSGTENMLERSKIRLDLQSELPDKAINSILHSKSESIIAESKHLEGLNPLNVLNRGYGMITMSDGKVLTSIDKIDVGDSIRVHMRDGTAEANVTSKGKKK